MALHKMVQGECGGENPLVALTRHFTRDSARNEVLGRRPDAAAMGSPAHAAAMAAEDHARMAEFMQHDRRAFGSGGGPDFAQAGAEWAGEFHPAEALRSDADEWAASYGPGVSAPPGASAVASPAPSAHYGSLGFYGPRMPMMSRLPPKREGPREDLSAPTAWASSYLQDDTQNHTVQPSSSVDEELRRTANRLAEQVDNEKVRETGGARVDDSAEGTAMAEQWVRDFSRQDATALNVDNLTAQMENTRLYPEDEDFFARTMGGGHAGGGAAQYEQTFHTTTHPEYHFGRESEQLPPDVTFDQLMEEGRNAQQRGALVHAILCFEGAVKIQPESSDAWELLGFCQAENEQEQQAIAALRESVRIEPGRQSAHLALAVSYTNEFHYKLAYEALEQALINNPAYASIAAVAPPVSESMTSGSTRFAAVSRLHERVRDMYIAAVQQSPDTVDSDIQSGLGVLFNINSDYEKAVDCFTTALRVRPDDAYLWNKLGATLANNDRNAEAVDAYRRALELRPGFIRARYNIGVSCINLRAYKEAAEHFLAALSLQQQQQEEREGAEHTMSSAIWSSLHMALVLDGKVDLAAATQRRDLGVFRGQYDF
eukprot:m.123059 g.123059  ORF g.123059 m.123059 type:complete len:600 (-) comp9639_c0_seq1:50-1849(-)